MPELPEVETVRDGLARHVLGATVTGVEVRRGSSVRRHDGGPEDFEGRLVGRTLSAAVRRGKFLWLVLDDAASGEALMAHLGMSGQLLVRGATAAGDPTVPGAAEPATEPATGPDPGAHPHLRTRLHLAPGPRSEGAAAPTSLDFVDQRTFGHLMVADLVPTQDGAPGGWGSDLAAVPAPAAHIARDLLDPHLDRPALVRALRRRRTDVKRALLDQTLVSGIGNIYADEALWRARTHFARQTDRLRPSDVERVLDAADAVMREALAAGGTSFDALYVNVNGASGYFDRSLAVYGQEGHPCPRCGTPVVRTAFMNRSSFTCPRCQRRGPATRAGARQQRQAP